MFGISTTLLATIILAALSAGGLAYAFLFGRIQNERTADNRLGMVTGAKVTERAGGETAINASRRRKSLQDTLKEVETRQKNRARKKIGMAERLEQAGLKTSLRNFCVLCIVLAVMFFGFSWLSAMPLYVSAAAFVVGGLGLPRWVVNSMRKRRLARFLLEFANAIDVIVRGVRSGLPLNDCVQIVANEASEPVRGEFERVVESQKLGMIIAAAVEKMPEYIPLPEVNFFAIIVSIQQRSGGNLSEALGNLSNVLRERKRMQGKIRAMSMEAKASAYIIAALPFIVMFLVYLTSPEYMMLLFTDQFGNLLLGLSAIWMTMGVLVMKKMINFDY